MKKISNNFHQGALTQIKVSVIYTGIALKLYQVSIHVHTCPSVATDDRERFQFVNTDCWYPFFKNNFGL